MTRKKCHANLGISTVLATLVIIASGCDPGQGAAAPLPKQPTAADSESKQPSLAVNTTTTAPTPTPLTTPNTSNPVPTSNSKTTNTGNISQTVKNEKYSLSVPKEWQVQQATDLSMQFKLAGNVIGSIEIEGIGPDNEPFLPNHVEVIMKKELPGYKQKVFEYEMKETPSAAAGNTTIKRSTHFYVIDTNKKLAYHLRFDTDVVKRTVMEEILKSLQV